MQCMKCGREIPSGQVFCAECLAGMEAYPVKPGTVVTLPTQAKTQPARKQPFHRPLPSQEERLKRLSKAVRVLSWSLTLSVAVLIGVSALAISMLQEDTNEELPGQNYSAEGESKAPPEWNLDLDPTEEESSEETTDGRPNINGIEIDP